MSVAAPKTPAKRRVATKPAPASKTSWLGYARDLITVRPGVDLTKPTLPTGKHFA
jgi:hypothetical protein